MASSNNPATQGFNVNEHVQEMPKEATPQRGSQDFVNPPTATLENEKSAVALEETSGLQSQPVGIEKPYSSFTKAEKWFIVVLTSVGGIFSPLASSSYFPAIPTMAQQFHKSIELINLTVTVYMVLQGVGPMVWGPICDRWGRRLVFLACLLILALSCVGLALTPTNAYWLLLLLRCVQAFGSASTIAVGAGVIADIAAQSERAGFFGLYIIGPTFGPCIAPVIGGGLVQGLGWRSTFWFLCIASGVWFLIMLLFFPETLRAMVGDGSVPPPRYARALIPLVGRRNQGSKSDRPPPKPLANPFRIFLNIDVDVVLLYNGLINSVFYGVIASISSLLNEVYPFLNTTDIGLCFLSIGGGSVLGSVVSGKVLDREYRKIKASHERTLLAQGKTVESNSTRDANFPIEMARFRTMPIYVLILGGACIGYGWCLEKKVNLSGPLILLFLMGYAVIGILNGSQTLLVDWLPGQGSSITACNNLVRCGLGAALVSVIDIIIRAIGIGWTYVILGMICFVNVPLIFFVIYVGPRFRAKRTKMQST